MGIPPPPAGAVPISSPPAGGRDPLRTINSWGVTISSGYRTPQHNKDVGGVRHSHHMDDDAVDLVPGDSGLSMGEIHRRAQAIADQWPNGYVKNEGDHVHIQLPGWGGAPGLPKPPKGAVPLTAGEPHDGDTFKLSNGQSGRLFGADAYELNQTGHRSNGETVPLGQLGRDFMAGRVPGQPFNVTGGESYGRPVGTVGTPDNDPGQQLLRSGYGLAAPEYLKGSPLFGPYMEAERLARLNRLGGHATDAVTPTEYRHGGGPFAQPEVSKGGKGIAIFGDEPTPFQGLRPEIEKGLMALWAAPDTTADDVLAYAKANGFQMPEAETRKRIKMMREGKALPASSVEYSQPPHPLIDPGDGRTGSFLRGFGDPINMIDELGGVADTVGLTPGRENIFNSDRRFGDILWNNIPQNRDILAHDDATHPNFRLGGQLASGLAFPALGVEGVAARAAEEALANGATRFAADIAGRKAVALRLAQIGGGEGGLMGFGAGEGGPIDRLPGAAVGAAAGAVAAPLLGEAINFGFSGGRRAINALRGTADNAAAEAATVVPDGVPPMDPAMLQRVNGGAAEGSDFNVMRPSQANGVQPLDPAMLERINGGASVSSDPVAAMAADQGPELVSGVVGRQRDYINVGPDGETIPPPPLGATPFGTTRPINERLSADEMAKLAEGVDPRSVLPRPSNRVESLSEAERANPGRFVELQAPNETDALPKLPMGQSNLFAKPKVRRDIYDVTKMLRKWGGVQDQGGELAHLGITNAPRDNLPFGRNEQFLGRLINDKGMTLDEAGEKLWEAGYFNERPTVSEVLDVLHQEHLGNSHFHPEDLGAVDEFHNLQGQRYAVEQARDEGAPLVDERGESINLDDLVANTPPANAYEEMPRLVGKVGNINLSHLEKSQDVAALIDQVSKRVGGFDAAARGKITHDETVRLAEELGLKPEQLLKRQQGQALNAEQLHASRVLVQRSRETVGRLAKKAVGGSDEDLMTFRKAWLRHVALEEQVAGATAETGRALSQMRALARGNTADANAVRAYLKGSGGRDSIEDAARAIVDLIEDPAKANHFMREAVKPRWRDKFNELYINSLLSGPVTHAVNFVGNALTTALSFPETAVAAGIGKLTRSSDRVYLREVGARAVGLAESSLDALKAARKTFVTGDASDEVTKVENAHHHAIGGRVGNFIRIPTRALTASDELWSGLLRGAALRQAAFRRAAGEGRDPAAIQARYEALMRAPPDDLLKQAEASARYYTFRTELGAVGRNIQGISNNWIGGKLVIPFVRTPINILKFAGERSVLGLAMPEVRAAIRAGGRARDEALAKITLGSGLSTAAVVGAMNGRISGGGPTDPQERAALLQSGWQPYSIRIGDRWVSYSRFDPVATLFGVAADFAEAGKWATKKEADVIALELSISIAKNITNKTWLSGLSDAFDVLSDPERYGRNYMQRMAGSLAVPALLNQTAQATDPYLRDARSIMDAIKARVPVLSKSVPARLNVWGDPMERGDAVGLNFVSPFYATKATRDPMQKELARIRAPLAMPERQLMVDGKRVDLTPEQFADYVRLSGQAAKSYLGEYVKTGEWKAMSDDERRDSVKNALKDFREAARDELRMRYPQLAGPGAAPPPPSYDLPPPPSYDLPPPPPGAQPLK